MRNDFYVKGLRKFFCVIFCASSSLFAAENTIDYGAISSAEIAYNIHQSLIRTSIAAKFEYEQARIKAGIYSEVLEELLNIDTSVSGHYESSILVHLLNNRFLNNLFVDSNIIKRDSNGIVYELRPALCHDIENLFADNSTIHTPFYQACVDFLTNRTVNVLLQYNAEHTSLMVKFGKDKAPDVEMHDVMRTVFGMSSFGQTYFLAGVHMFVSAAAEHFPDIEVGIDIDVKDLTGQLSWEFAYNLQPQKMNNRSSITVNVDKKIEVEMIATGMKGKISLDESPFTNPTLKIIVDKARNYSAQINVGSLMADAMNALAFKTGRLHCGINLSNDFEVTNLSIEKNKTEFGDAGLLIGEPIRIILNINDGDVVDSIKYKSLQNIVELTKLNVVIGLIRAKKNSSEIMSLTCVPNAESGTMILNTIPQETPEEHAAHAGETADFVNIPESIFGHLIAGPCKQDGVHVEKGTMHVEVDFTKESTDAHGEITVHEGQVLSRMPENMVMESDDEIIFDEPM